MTTVNLQPITVNGVELPPAKIHIGYNPLWSPCSGRMSNGDFDGDITAYKWRIDATWKPVSAETMKKILSTIYCGKPFLTVKFINPFTNDYITAKMYPSEFGTDVYSYAIPEAVYDSLPISLVEK